MSQAQDQKGGKLLAALRQEAHLTQTDLAERAKVSRSMVAQLEMGARRPSRKLIHALCKVINATQEQEQQLLLSYEFRPSGQTPEQIAAFLRADKNLTDEQAEKIARLVRDQYDHYVSKG